MDEKCRDYYNKTHKSHSEKSNMYLTYKSSRREVKENETQELFKVMMAKLLC